MTGNLEYFGPGARFHHVGLAVSSIDATVPGLEKTEDPVQRVRVAFADFSGLAVELIEPACADSPVDASLKKGVKLLHVCIEVPSLESALEHGRRHGFRRISAPAPAAAFQMRGIVWVFHGAFGLVELLEAGAAEKDG